MMPRHHEEKRNRSDNKQKIASSGQHHLFRNRCNVTLVINNGILMDGFLETNEAFDRPRHQQEEATRPNMKHESQNSKHPCSPKPPNSNYFHIERFLHVFAFCNAIMHNKRQV